MKLIFTTLFIIVSYYLVAQTRISGTVKDQQGQPIPMANIILLDSYDGTSSNKEGKFDFTTDERGSRLLNVKFIGFKEQIIPVELAGKSLSFQITLKEEISELKTVTISAGAFNASDESRRTVFKAIDIATTAGATADIAGALNTLPGTTKVGESGRLFVRGGDGNETRTFIDGLLVLDAYSPSAPNTPSRGRFLPFMFKGMSFSTGGYSAEYGQALSSALALDSKDETEVSRTDIGLLSVGGDVAHTYGWNSGSASAKIQYTNLKPYVGLINQSIDWIAAPESFEGVSVLRQKVGKNGMMKLYGNINNSFFSLNRHDIDDEALKTKFALRNKYRYGNASYKSILNKNWIVRGGFSYTFIGNDMEINAGRREEVEKSVHTKAVVDGSLSEHVELKAGAEIITRSFATQGTYFLESLHVVFAESDLIVSNNFLTRVGARLEHNSLTNAISVDPRISMAYRTGAFSQVSFSYGKFRQSPKNEWLRVDRSLQQEKAAHYIINYQLMNNDRTFRIESFYKKYNDLIAYSNTDFSDVANNGYGYAKGIELFWRDKKSLEAVDYWISYSFLDTKRNYLNYGALVMPSFVSKHNFSFVGKYFIADLKSQLGLTYSHASGRPYFNPNKTTLMTDRTPYYSDLSINWSYLPKPNVIIHLSCTNLLGRDNVFGYEFGNRLNDNGMYTSRAVGQPARRFLFLGIFLTLSKEKSVNQLPIL